MTDVITIIEPIRATILTSAPIKNILMKYIITTSEEVIIATLEGLTSNLHAIEKESCYNKLDTTIIIVIIQWSRICAKRLVS